MPRCINPRGDRCCGDSPIAAACNARKARLAELDASAHAGELTIAFALERAQLLDRLGRTDEARRSLLDLLARDAGHPGVLNELGRLLARTGYHAAAQTVFARAVTLYPDDAVAHCNLGNVLLDSADDAGARRHYKMALRLQPDLAAAHASLAILLLRLGDEPQARHHAAIGFGQGAAAWPYRGIGDPVEILVIHSALGGNVWTEPYIDDRTFAKRTLVAEFIDATAPLPPHTLIFNAVGDADRCGVALRAAAALAARSAAPVINHPAHVLGTGRYDNARRLAGMPGVVVPHVIQWPRERLGAPHVAADLGAAGLDWPLIVRAPGFHTGEHCVLVADAAELTAALVALPGDDILVIAYVDVRRPDGYVRKYRVMMVAGELFPLHLAISADWKVHYFTAGMADHAEHRREEAAFLADMPQVLGARGIAALSAIAERLELDYGGIDFGLDSAGNVVLFEANATMIVPLPDDDPIWDYRRAPVARIHSAVREMVLARALPSLEGPAR